VCTLEGVASHEMCVQQRFNPEMLTVMVALSPSHHMLLPSGLGSEARADQSNA
jgi:hypothetical protein